MAVCQVGRSSGSSGLGFVGLEMLRLLVNRSVIEGVNRMGSLVQVRVRLCGLQGYFESNGVGL